MPIPLTIKLKEDFYIQDLLLEGFEIEYWNVSPILHSIELIDSVDDQYVKKFDSYKVLKTELAKVNINKDLLVLQVTYNFQSLKLYRIAKKSKLIIAFFDRPGFTLNYNKKSTRIYLRKLFNINMYTNYIKTIIALIARKFRYVNIYDIVFTAGTEAAARYSKPTCVIPINHYDYDNYIKNDLYMENLVSQKYAVFLDEYLPFHPDFGIVGLPTVSAEQYFKKINDFFSKVENELNLQIIIALHPKSNYRNNPFNGRHLIKYKTANLIKFADFVFSHASTSVSYCAIYKKPVYFIYFNDFESLYVDTLFLLLKALASDFNIKPINIDDVLFEPEIFNENISYDYKNYVSKYLSSEECKLLHTSKIISRFLSK